ncbi:zinc finger CCCH domain-containing protein 29-like [Vitis riparia]|uniref:zinc finger CCCH domain-containing protein 29-like n=1 Tax=Vitis riparia TaxID=96939 RepID=UPI00155A545C|nr:zinc finger CCCH domain-containing protein 29-like [Vitis riparia]
MNQLRASYPTKTTVTSSPVGKTSSYGFDSSAAVAAAVMNSRSSAFAKRSQSFIDRGGMSHRSPGFTAASNSATLMSSNLSDWSSPDGKLDWGIQGDELNKLKKSASFGFRTNNTATATQSMMASTDEPDVSWVNSLVKDVPSVSAGLFGSQQQPYGIGVHEKLPPWVEQMYIEQEQMVA